MKLRIKGNSLRLRLDQREVETFAATGGVSATAALAPKMHLVYGLLVLEELDEVDLAYTGHTLTVRIPKALADEWTSTDRVGFEAVSTAGGEEVRVLVEKDFRCLHKRPGEDESNHYPHPAEAGSSAD